MPPKNERHRVRNQNNYPIRKQVNLEDYEKHLLESIAAIENDIQETQLDHRPRFDNRRNEIIRLSQMHQHLRNFQLSQ